MSDDTDWAKVLGELSADLTLSCNQQIAAGVAEAFSKTVLPPELAGQVASAVRLLHESPAIAAKEVPRPPAPKVTRIERDADGNFVPVYDETQP
jgi:hypothetical protein